MDQVVAILGGRRADELYTPSNGEKNADYVFEPEGIVMELKSLEKDQFADTVVRLESLIREWVQAGHLPPPKPGLTIYETRSVPTGEQRRVLKQIEDRVRDTVKSANKQIKKTKERLGMKDAKGVLMLVNDGNTVLELERAFYVLARVFRPDAAGKRPFSGIDRLVYLTYDMPGVTSLGPRTQVWATPLFGDGDTSLSPFFDRLKNGWFKHLEAKTGEPMPVFNLDPKSAQNIRFRDDTVPLNRQGNDLLATGFQFGEGTEQELIDALGSQVKRLSGSSYTRLEMMRMLITPTAEWNPLTMFPAFQRLCHGFQIRSAIASHTLENWPGMVLLSVHISKRNAPEHYDQGQVMPNGAIPFIAEVPLIEGLPNSLLKLEANLEVELCGMDMEDGEPLDLAVVIPCVWRLCEAENVALIATERKTDDGRTISVLMRKRYV